MKNILESKYPLINPIYRWTLGKRKQAIGLVFMLHRVGDFTPGGLRPNEHLKVTESFLEHIIKRYKKQGFEFVSLNDVSQIIQKKKTQKRKFIAFTLDDGYEDNFTKAYPIFKKHQIPFAVFIASDFPNRKAILWWYSLEKLLLSHNSIELEGYSYDCSTYEKKCDTFMILRDKVLGLTNTLDEDSLNRLFSNYSVDWRAETEGHVLSWPQIIEMNQDPLCTIGGHTVTHSALNRLSTEQVANEVMQGVDILEQNIGQKIEHFAYPYGSSKEVGEPEFAILARCGFKTCFCAEGGCITQKTTSILSLPRVMLSQL